MTNASETMRTNDARNRAETVPISPRGDGLGGKYA
jgi:multidrug resistance efflux pump